MLPETGDRKTEAIQRSLLHYIRSLSLFSTATIAFIITQNDRFWIIFDSIALTPLHCNDRFYHYPKRSLLDYIRSLSLFSTPNDASPAFIIAQNDRFYHYSKRSLLYYIRFDRSHSSPLQRSLLSLPKTIASGLYSIALTPLNYNDRFCHCPKRSPLVLYSIALTLLNRNDRF